MSYRLARFISVVFHPVFMPTYSFFLLFGLSSYFNFITSASVKQVIFGIVIFNTLIMPLLITRMLYKRKFISSYQLGERKERIIPFFCTAILIMLSYYMFRKLGLPRVFYMILLGAAASLTLAVLLTLKWKISIHMIGIGGVAGMFLGLSESFLFDFRIPFAICILLAGAIGVARLSMNSHKPIQIYTGFLLGFFCEYLILSI